MSPSAKGLCCAVLRRSVMSDSFATPWTIPHHHACGIADGVGKCEWDGAVWPFATSQTLTALANFANDYTARPVPSGQSVPSGSSVPSGFAAGALSLDSLYFAELEKYMQSQHMRGKPYIGEYLDETTGYWLKGDQERSRYYNHSTWNDLIITGLCGLRPRQDNTIEVNPLLPQNKWDYFCL